MQENLSGRCATPVWLLRSYVDSMLACGATASEDALSMSGEKLLFRWGAQQRVFHNTRYLAAVIAHIDELSDACHDPNLLRVVAWYMGAVEPVSVYLPDENFSARITQCQEYMEKSCLALGIPTATLQRLQELVALTLSHDPAQNEVDAAVLNDADLAVLAGTPQEYKKYRLGIREENRTLDDFSYLQARRRFVKALLRRKHIFKSPVGAQWEAGARQNLEAELENLDAAICHLDPTCESEIEWQVNETNDPTTTSTALIFKRSAINVPIEVEAETTSCALPKFVCATEEALPDDTSSLEFEPTILEKRTAGVVRRLSAKELARQASKRKQQETSE